MDLAGRGPAPGQEKVCGGFPHPLVTEARWFEGARLSALPAGHPDAWSLHNQVFQRRLDLLCPGGVLIVPTPAGDDRTGAVMALVGTLRSVRRRQTEVAASIGGDVIELALVARRAGRTDRRGAGGGWSRPPTGWESA